MIADADIAKYEGLVFRTAILYEGRVEGMDLDDLRQTFRIKVWTALQAYDPSRSSLPEGRYVFGCLYNQGKDLLRRKKRRELYIEDIAPERTALTSNENSTYSNQRDKFEAKYMALQPEEVYGLIENEDAVVPNTLDHIERRVVCLIYANYNKGEIAKSLGLSRRELGIAFVGIETKMADWSPTSEGRPVGRPS